MGYAYGHGYGYTWLGKKRGVSALAAVGGAGMLTGETNGFATDFGYAVDAKRVAIKTSGVVVEKTLDEHYQNAGTSSKQVFDISGNLVWVPHNYALQSENLALSWGLTNLTAASATQIRPTSAANVMHRLSMGLGVITGETYTHQWIVSYPAGSTYKKFGIAVGGVGLSGNGVAFDIEAGTVIYSDAVGWTASIVPGPAAGQFTITGVAPGMNSSCFQAYVLSPSYVSGIVSAIWTATDTATGINIHRQQVNRGAVPLAYLPNTTSTIRYGLAIDYDPVTHAPKGLLCELAATNLILNSTIMSTQNCTVTAVAYTLSFYGTGTITLSGVSTAGPLVGTGAGRVTLTFTPTAGSLTLTVSGTVSNAQLETGSVATSPIKTFATTQIRAVDNVTCLVSTFPWNAAGPNSILMTAAAKSVAASFTFLTVSDGTNTERIILAAGPSPTLATLVVVDGGITVGSPVVTGTPIADTYCRMGAVAAANDMAIVANGSAAAVDTVGAMPTVTTVYFGLIPATGGQNTYTKSVVIVPRRMTNVELQTKTT